jgi:hypothetical protein
MVRAKFTVISIKRHEGSGPVKNEDGSPKLHEGRQVYGRCEMRTIELSPVYGNGDPNHENTKFWQSSPSGKIELGTINLDAAEAFELGKDYYVDFTRAPE